MRYVLLLLLLSAPLQAQPTLDHASPSAISPKGGRITLNGTGFKDPLAIWSTLQLDCTFSNTTPASTMCQLTYPNAITDQFLALRLATSSGISSPILVAIDDLPSISATGQNKSIKTAQPINLPVAIEGSIDELTSHFYKFPARKNRKLQIDVVANRIGSRLDPLVRLLDASGKELIFSDDDPAIAPDSRFSFTVPSDGDYILEIRDAAYEGSAQHRYRLRVDENQWISPPIRQHPATLPTTTEREPNDLPGTSTPFKIPAQLHGIFDKPRDRDMYEFKATKGDRVLIRSKTRSIGSPCDLVLRIVQLDG
ncbi:MAG TPA: PPC domain-containing protein, partial [Tepidisphaeraceae bacterium]|nr:PPC domain-containing protein [Tepidisphaeraceae bacterium]